MVQTCTVHLIRAGLRYASYGDRKKLAAALKPVYTAPSADAAESALLELAESELGRKYKAAIAVWERAWDRFIPFLEFPRRSGRSSTRRMKSSSLRWSAGRFRLPVSNEDLVCVLRLLGNDLLRVPSLFVVVGRARQAVVAAP
jgi:hypothetical protein